MSGENSDVRELTLSREMVALVDAIDYDRVAQYAWWADRCSGLWYAYRKIYTAGKGRRVTLHRFILNLTDSRYPYIDHKNRNGLDCRRKNLRLATYSENSCNTKTSSRNTSGYRGVIYEPRKKSHWLALIKKNNKQYYLDLHQTPIEAALAYDKAARELHGEFAVLNFPQGDPR